MDLSSITQYLFTSKNFDKWLLASKEAVLKTYNDEPADIMASHEQQSAYQANWKNQIGKGSDPEIKFKNSGIGTLYMEDGEGGKQVDLVGGANVYVREATDMNNIKIFLFLR